MKWFGAHWLLLLVIAAATFCISGCATDEPANASVRPWNTPQTWESGMPSMGQQHQ
jgi:hypothetical protein